MSLTIKKPFSLDYNEVIKVTKHYQNGYTMSLAEFVIHELDLSDIQTNSVVHPTLKDYLEGVIFVEALRRGDLVQLVVPLKTTYYPEVRVHWLPVL